MKTDRELMDGLVRVAAGYQTHAEVLELEEPPRGDALLRRATAMAKVFWNDFRQCTLRDVVVGVADLMTVYRFPDGGALSVFPPSGAVEATLTDSARVPLAPDERRAERKRLRLELERLGAALAKSELQADEELKVEAFWETKGRAVTTRNESGPTVLFEVVGAFRRHVAGLPVLGRASVYVKLGAGQRPTGWGIEWRRRSARVIAKVEVISPEEASKRIATELFRLRPERPPSEEDFEPVSLQLAYVSSGRRSFQRSFQPAWVAVLKGKNHFGIGEVVAVPAAPAPFGPLLEPVRPQVAVERSPLSRQVEEHSGG